MNSKQIWAKINAAKERLAAFMRDGKTEDALRVEGEINALNERLSEALEQEEAARADAAAHPVHTQHKTLAEAVFGSRDAFRGIDDGFRASAPVSDAVSGLDTPQIYRRDLPAPVAPPNGFLGTILKGTTDGDEHFFQTPVLTNNAAGWVSGDKPESAMEWKEAVANIETIAHWIPIKKQTANRYSQLESIVSGALMLGLDLRCNEYALRGSNSSGIVGVCNTPGILQHTKVADKNLKDTLQTMRRKARVASGIAPNYVCLSPYAIEELSQAKDAQGRYLFPDLANGDTIAGLTIVEDVNMTTGGDNPKETALVYWGGGASFDIADPQEVAIGLTNSQVIQNEYTILAELTAALRVDTPASFCYCPDLGLTVE